MGNLPLSDAFDTKSKAEAWAATVESEIARGMFVSPAEAWAAILQKPLERYTREITRVRSPSLSTVSAATFSHGQTRPWHHDPWRVFGVKMGHARSATGKTRSWS